MKGPTKTADERELLYIRNEAAANRFNLVVLGVFCLFAVLTEILNEFGVFKVAKIVMRPTMIVTLVILGSPIVIRFVHDRLLHRKPSVLEDPRFKHLILTVIYFGIGLICVSLTHNVVILTAVPPVVAAQYRSNKRITRWAWIASLLLVPIEVYGGYFFGAPDRNFIKGVMSEEEFAIFSNRVASATPTRMFELFTHYVIPRLLCVLAVIVLASGVIRRHRIMLAEQTKLSQKVHEEMERRNGIQSHVIETLASLIETRDDSTGEHVIRTKRYVTMLADAMKRDERFRDRLTDPDIERIENAAPLHDVGKIAISDTILLKPGKLTPEEFEIMKTHAPRGGEMIRTLFADLDDPLFLRTAEEIAVSHHEKWNGTGYPDGKKGEEIPLSARIMAVADVFDALVSFRVYKASISPELALDTMMAESGTHFDPDIMQIMDGMRQEFIDAAQSGYAESVPQ